MLKPEQVPDEVIKAFEDEFHFGEGDWKRNCIIAAINAWPGMEYDPGALVTDAYRDLGKIILPLPQGASDE